MDKLSEGQLETMIDTVEEVIKDGFSAEQLIRQFYLEILSIAQLDEIVKSQILEKAADCDRSLKEGAREDL